MAKTSGDADAGKPYTSEVSFESATPARRVKWQTEVAWRPPSLRCAGNAVQLYPHAIPGNWNLKTYSQKMWKDCF